MKLATDLHELNRRLDTWRNRRLTPWLTWTAGGIIGVISGIDRWPPCLKLGNIVALIVFVTSMFTFFTIRRIAIKKLETKIKQIRQ